MKPLWVALPWLFSACLHCLRKQQVHFAASFPTSGLLTLISGDSLD